MRKKKILLLGTHRDEDVIHQPGTIIHAYFVKNEQNSEVAMIQSGVNLRLVNCSYRELTAQELITIERTVVLTSTTLVRNKDDNNVLKLMCGERYEISSFTPDGTPVISIEYVDYLLPDNCFILEDYLNNFKQIKNGLF